MSFRVPYVSLWTALFLACFFGAPARAEVVSFDLFEAGSPTLVEVLVGAAKLTGVDRGGFVAADKITRATCRLGYHRETEDSKENELVCDAAAGTKKGIVKLSFAGSRINAIRQFRQPRSANVFGAVAKELFEVLQAARRARPAHPHLCRDGIPFADGSANVEYSVVNKPCRVLPDGIVSVEEPLLRCNVFTGGAQSTVYFCGLADPRE